MLSLRPSPWSLPPEPEPCLSLLRGGPADRLTAAARRKGPRDPGKRRWQVADIEVELTLLPTAAGGRRNPAGQGYRPQFYYNNGDWDAFYEYEIAKEVPLGQLVRACLTFLSPQEHRGRV